MELCKIVRFRPKDNVQTFSDCIAIFSSNHQDRPFCGTGGHLGFHMFPSPPPKCWHSSKMAARNARAWPRLSFLLQLESLRSRLDDREEQLKQKEKKLISVSSEHSENSYAVENLQSVLNTKERQVTSLKKKVCSKCSAFFQVFSQNVLKCVISFLFSISYRQGS